MHAEKIKADVYLSTFSINDCLFIFKDKLKIVYVVLNNEQCFLFQGELFC